MGEARNPPPTVPHKAKETVMPSVTAERPKAEDIPWVAPEITAVSKPRRRPPRAATTVLKSMRGFNFMDV
jgi:hypothetical protein